MTDIRDAMTTYLAGNGPFKLEVGAGSNGKAGWLATDFFEHANPNSTYTHHLDVTKDFPIKDATFDYIYSEHMIEHISFEGGQRMLKECNRILKPNAIIRIVTPSLGFMMRVMSPDRSLFERSYIEWSLRTFVPEAKFVTNAFFLNNFMRKWGHTFIYDHDTLLLAMKGAGFINIIECPIGRSQHLELSKLEYEERLPPGFLELESMIFEGTKPQA